MRSNIFGILPPLLQLILISCILVYYVPGDVLRPLCRINHLLLSWVLGFGHNHEPIFTDGEFLQKFLITWLRWTRWHGSHCYTLWNYWSSCCWLQNIMQCILNDFSFDVTHLLPLPDTYIPHAKHWERRVKGGEKKDKLVYSPCSCSLLILAYVCYV